MYIASDFWHQDTLGKKMHIKCVGEKNEDLFFILMVFTVIKEV